MKVLLIHLSDIHFKETDNAILDKKQQLFEAVRNQAIEYDKIFLVVTGDTAYSGKLAEYEIAASFLEEVRSKIKAYASKDVMTIVIPGNHDCDFSLDDKSRQNQVTIIQKLGEAAIDESVIEQCLKVQENFQIFSETYSEKPKYSNKVFSSYQFDFNEKRLIFYTYNTSFLSEIREQNGKMFYPINKIEGLHQSKGDLVISMFHHPFHWLNTTNRREFSTKIHETSDFYLTGHEHTFSQSSIDNLDDNIVYHIEGSVLQDSGNKFESEFNVIGFDLANQTFKTEKYFWNTDRYAKSDNLVDWRSYKRGQSKWKNKYTITPEFTEFLDDIGGKFKHPAKSHIKLEDLFVFPRLRHFTTTEASEETTWVTESSESVIKNLTSGSKLLLFGAENIGKTSLLKISYKILFQKGFIPIFINGGSIRNSSIGDFKNVVAKAFVEQYSDRNLSLFEQEDVSNIFILIDDLDKNPLKNQKAKGRFIKGLNENYRNTILVGNELFAIEEIISDEEVAGDLYSTFDQHELLEFSHSLRVQLIKQWYTLGREDYISDVELAKKCDLAVQSITTAMGYRIVPNYPIFLLILLQAVETSNPHDLQISSYGNYYALLILKSFTDGIKNQADQNTYQNYCTELAYLFFSKKTSAISESEHLTFHKEITSFDRFDLPGLSQEKIIQILVDVGVIANINNTIEFKYRYTYYYFVAKYLAQKIDQPKTKAIISKMVRRLHRTEFANIVMFIIHFNKNEFILEELLNAAKEIFNDLQPCKLENDVQQMTNLVTELPKLYLKSQSYQQVRAQEDRVLDKQEAARKGGDDTSNNPWDIDEDVSEIDVVANLNSSFKLMEILGQVIKNQYGAMTGPTKMAMLRETYSMGLRTLNLFFVIFNDNTDFVLNLLKESLSKYKKVSEDKVEKVARNILFALSTQISFVFIKKIADSIGSAKLLETYQKVELQMDYSSVKLINYLIKIEHSNGFHGTQLKDINDALRKYPMSYFLLKRMVLNHLQRNPMEHRERQRVCQFLGISIENQMKIESGRKKTEAEENIKK